MHAGMGLAQAVGDVFALPEGERALAGGDADGFHPVIIAPSARIRPTAEPLVAGVSKQKPCLAGAVGSCGDAVNPSLGLGRGIHAADTP